MQSGSAAANPTAGLTPADRRRLAGVLGLLSSNIAGERDAAAEAATRLLQARGMSWHDVLTLQDAPLDARAGARRAGARQDAAADLEMVGRHFNHLDEWQSVFCTSLARRRTPLTVGQREKLRQIADRLRARGLT